MSSDGATATEVLTPAEAAKAARAVYADRTKRALATRARAQENVAAILSSIENQDRDNWFANKYLGALDAAEQLELPQVVINGLDKYVRWLNEAEKAGERDLNRIDREELAERRELLIAHLKQENPELLQSLLEGHLQHGPVDEADGDEEGPVPDLVDTSQTEGC